MVPESCGVHDGSFHADEVLASALLVKFELVVTGKIIRSRDSSKLSFCEYLCDVGDVYDESNGRFDHHQSEYTGDLSSAGMVLKYLLHKKIIDNRLYEFLNRKIVRGVDLVDNGILEVPYGCCTFSNIISLFVPNSYSASSEEYDEKFFEALKSLLVLLIE